MTDKEKNEIEQKAPRITTESVKKFTDEELDKVAGGIYIIPGLPIVICPPGCKYIQNGCDCD